MKKKAWVLALLLLAGFAAATVSLSRTSGSAEYVAAALGQSRYRLDVATLRGKIYDCNGEPLVGRETVPVAAVAPTIETIGALDQLTGGAQRVRLRTALEDGKPFLLELEENLAERAGAIPGVEVFQIPRRLEENQPAVHLLGMTDSLGQGVSGIELAMDDVLAGRGGAASVTYQVDALGRVVPGGPREVENTLEEAEGGVQLTLDREIQALAERTGAALEKGAVVVAEVPDCRLRAVASFPGFSPEDPLAAGREDAPLLNRAFCAYTPGSVFKLAVAAAVLERGLPLEDFTCTGAVNVDGLLFHCYGGIPHGTVGLQEALEQSCNGYFINCGRSLGGQPILDAAYNLGLGEELEFGRGLFSDSGTLPDAAALTHPRALANCSFGQGEVTVTPLQMTALVHAIATGGTYHSPRLIQGVADASGRLIPARPVTEREVRVMKESTARILQAAMEGAVREGTARPGDPGNGAVAGVKTGTAQTGRMEDGRELLNFWYCGYLRDADGPRYCITVLAEGTPDDEGAAARVFRETAQGLAQLIG